jgi:NADPH-dependent curcumin reductase CurA
VLVWGASGGLGSMAMQLCATAGANAIGVISDDDKRDFVMSARRQGRHQPQRLQVLGPDAPVDIGGL